MTDLDRWVMQVRTRRGAVVCIRPLRPDDREREIAFINSLSERSRYFRLFTPLKVLPRHLIDRLMDIDYLHRMAFVATTLKDGVEQFVGVSVADTWQRCGIASLLMQQLIRYAREHDINRMTGLVLPDNLAMIALARRLAFTVRYDPAQHLFLMSRDLCAPETSQIAPYQPLQDQTAILVSRSSQQAAE